ncbi:hypothetical protein [Rhizobium giardinii]|uniref:Uncharacterized protein involved in outer membrane biogenesis n=1 Tax=Rhizobium giardinii TaxID=56731 RepID=A0A7W8X6S0_9HYPH|nr:hypothetical protein [Rhizobium giardinii]MBB5533931.1 uncharacterized protein involved in outer membrane biogenesis [Rhizobium giardinii]
MRQNVDLPPQQSRAPQAASIAVGALVLVMLFKVALPLFISTASVKLNMERALSSWTGARAAIAGNPDISFWPHPVLTLHA